MSPSTTTMKSSASYRRGTGYATKGSRQERRLHSPPSGSQSHFPWQLQNQFHTTCIPPECVKISERKQRTADKHKVKKQRIADRRRKLSEQQPFAEAETPAHPTETATSATQDFNFGRRCRTGN